MRLHHVFEEGLNNKVPGMRERCAELYLAKDNIVQFDFGDITNIPRDELNDLMQYARDLWNHNIYDLPYADVCYSYRYATCDMVSCATFDKEEDRLYIVSFCFHKGVLMCGVDAWLTKENDNENRMQYGFIDDTYKSFLKDHEYKEWYLSELSSSAVQSLTIMLQSKGVQIKNTPAPDKLNIARAKKGKPPIGEINEITIRLNEKTYHASGAEVGSGSSKRLHWRRGHIRRLPCGEITNVRPCLVGKIGKGNNPPPTPTYKIKAA